MHLSLLSRMACRREAVPELHGHLLWCCASEMQSRVVGTVTQASQAKGGAYNKHTFSKTVRTPEHTVRTPLPKLLGGCCLECSPRESQSVNRPSALEVEPYYLFSPGTPGQASPSALCLSHLSSQITTPPPPLLPLNLHPPWQDVPGGGAGAGAGAAQAAAGPVPEDAGGGPASSLGGRARPEGRHQAPLHAVEGDAELHAHAGLPHRRRQGEAQGRAGQARAQRPVATGEASEGMPEGSLLTLSELPTC